MATEERTIRLAKVIAATIAESPDGAPSGHIYAALMGQISLHEYESIIFVLKKTKLIEETPGHLLRWTGPKQPVKQQVS